MFLPSVPPTPVFLYPETHFRFFPFFPSILFKKEPEIVFDLPYRCGPGKDLPVVLMVNDVDQFPAEVKETSITVSQKGMQPILFTFGDPGSCLIPHPFGGQSRVFRFVIKRDEIPSGRILVNCKAVMTSRKRSWTVVNDNFATTSKLPFSCFAANEPLPGADRCSFGDLHVHSQYSQSHVEFGPPIRVIDTIADTCGLDFLSITDHSYDLCCSMTDFLKADSGLTRWKSSSEEITRSDGFKTVVLQGEEISVLNSRRKAVHLCGIGISRFISGSADGARSGKLPTLSLTDAIRHIHRQGGIAVAAHPGSRFGFSQRLFLHRGNWSRKDMSVELDAVQAVNNGFGNSWLRARNLWIAELLKGRRMPLVAGNDSHGDFNRYRYVSVPFLDIAESFTRHLSGARTGIYRKARSQEDIIAAIINGETFVTSGPFLRLAPTQLSEKPMAVPLDCQSATIEAISSCEFGGLNFIQVFAGEPGERAERIIFSKTFKGEKRAVEEIKLSTITRNGYLRTEAVCKREDGSLTFAATSPLYFGHDRKGL